MYYPLEGLTSIKKLALIQHWLKLAAFHTEDIAEKYKDVDWSGYPDEDLKRMYTSKAEILEQYDNMTKIRDRYTGKIFFHQVYYKLERHYFDSQVLEALEMDAQLISKSVDDVIGFIDAIESE